MGFILEECHIGHQKASILVLGLPLSCHVPLGKTLNLSGLRRDERLSLEALLPPPSSSLASKPEFSGTSTFPRWLPYSLYSAVSNTWTSAPREMGASTCKSPTSSTTKASGGWCRSSWPWRSCRRSPAHRPSRMMAWGASFHSSLKKVPNESWGQTQDCWSFPSQRP